MLNGILRNGIADLSSPQGPLISEIRLTAEVAQDFAEADPNFAIKTAVRHTCLLDDRSHWLII